MTSMSLERIRRDGERFMQEVSREYYMAHAGLKSTAELQPIYDRHAAVLDGEALASVLDTFKASVPGSEEHRSARILLEWLAESHASRALAAHDEREIAWENTAVVNVTDGRAIPYQRVAIEIANTVPRGERLAIESARAELVERELAPLKRERLERERDLMAALGIGHDYVATFEVVSGIRLAPLVVECQRFLSDTQAMWDEVHPRFVRAVLGIPVAEATRADALTLFRAHEFDRYFPSDAMEAAIRRQTREMGIDPEAGGHVRFDVGDREGKRSRAFCAPVRVPEEVYLVLRPHGGQSDYTTFLHELGHALHFASVRPGLPFEYRWLGDNSVTEGYAMLFDHLVQSRGWLQRYSELAGTALQRFVRAAGHEELHFIRRYCAKLLYEVELYDGRTAWPSLPDVYVDLLSGATSFRYQRADAFVDVDPRFYAARYLRAWQLQALIADTLTERFDEDWYRNPRAGPWMVEALFGEGQRELATELAERIAARPLTFTPLVRAIEQRLAA